MWTCELGKCLQKETAKKQFLGLVLKLIFPFQKFLIALDFSIRWSISASFSYFYYVCVQGKSLSIRFAICNANGSHEEKYYKFTSNGLT